MTEQTTTQPQLSDVIFRSTADGILIANPNGVIAQVNPAAAAMLTVVAEDIVGKSPLSCFRQNPALLNLFTRGGDQTLDVRLPRRRLAVGIATTLETGERLVMLQDVTEKRNLDARREALTKAISHDLRNPLSAISGFADLISKFGELNEQQARFMTRIRQTANKLHEMTRPLVELAWIEAGMPLEHVPLQLGESVNRAVHAVSPLAKENQITIAVSLQDPLPLVTGDAERLYLVIYNLLQNAVIYSDPERTVAIHAWSDEVDVYCSVADRGFGISDNELDQIFDRMYRSRDERVREKPGGGLGLTLANTIIERHGGDIWASSNLGEGSTFTFVLPAAKPQG